MPSVALSKLIFIFFVSNILSHVSVTIALNRTTNIGVIIDESSRAGKEQKTAIEIAVQKLNSGSNDHKLAIHFKNSSGDPLEAASSAKNLIDKQDVRVIIGTSSWEETTLVAKNRDDDSSNPPDMSDEINCITSIVQSYNWKRVIVVYEDNAYGGEYGALSLLSEELQKIGSIVEQRVVLPHLTTPFDPKETIRDELVEVLTTKQSRVFIVLKSSLPTATRVFEEANKLGLMGQDSVWIIGDSISSFLDSINSSFFRRVQGALGIKTSFTGLTGQIAFQDEKLSDPHKFQLVNIIGVPDAPSFDRFVKVEWVESTNETKYSGLCIEVFKSVVVTLEKEYNYTLPYEFVNHTGTYNDLVEQVSLKNYDAVVGDVTILANRSKYVDFTQPFTESGLSMVVPVKSEPDWAWKFMKPFTPEMWLATFGILFYTMFVVWYMEHQVNHEFRGPWKDQLGTALWFTFSSLFFAHREKIRSNHSKVVVMIWLFVVFILSSSYTASLTSMLTVRMLEPTVRDIEWLRKTNAPVGCDPDSFVDKYLRDVLKLKNIKSISLQSEYPDNFKNKTISAAFLELPYEKYFLKEYCNEYTAVGPSYKFGGLGFVFPKDSPITDDVSGAILYLMEEGKIRELENQWLNTSQTCSNSNPGLDSERLSLANFWGIFLISGLTSTLSFLTFLYRLLHNRIEQRIISFNESNGSRWNNESRWRKAVRLVQIVLNLNHHQIEPRESSHSAHEWSHRNPPQWELVSPSEVPEHLEIGRPTQLKIPMRKMEHIGFLHLASSMQLDVVFLVDALGPELVLGFAPVESGLSQLDLQSAALGLQLVSTQVHVESVVLQLESALVHLTIQII
ncbi:glutamate receptor 2.9-like protein [Tanacetum coccineum]|uniref:Glutamate receptor n=1 Tax=Tanacetum coccineum TaxID=301880 RepID=A0ABQ5J271_9ASTR